jgi:N-acylglucosamine 2-epimerase
VLKGTISIYTDMFALSALCEYAAAGGGGDDAELIRRTYDVMERNVRDPDFKDIYHGTWSPQYKRHGVYMMALPTASLAGGVVGADRTRSLVDQCLHEILHVFSKDRYEATFESVGRDGRFVDSPEGRLLNPGHALESMWFCMAEGRKRNDRFIVERAAQLADWAYRRGHDDQCGGIFAFVDSSGQEPLQMDYHKETAMRWDDKSWWVHCEALVALAMAYVYAGRDEFLGRFVDLHKWCQDNFYDPQFGEWTPILWRDGRPKMTDHGQAWKCAYHLPRALMMVMQVLEEAARQARLC